VQKIIIAVMATTIMAAAASVLAVFVASQTIPNTMYVKTVGVGVYWDSGSTNEVSSINWGNVEPGETTSKTIYVKNEGTVPMILTMTTGGWNPPSASSYVTLSWNRDGYVLDSGAVVQAVLTLSLSSSVSGITSISFDTTITGTEQT